LRADDYLPLVSTLQRVPASPRDFTVSSERGRDFGLAPVDLEALARAGLPHRRAGRDYVFRWGDLHYLGLRLGTARSYLLGIKRWARSFTQLSQRTRTHIAVDYTPRPDRVVPEGVLASAILPGGRRRSLVLGVAHKGITVEASQCGLWPKPEPRLAEILERFAELQLYVIPDSLRHSATATMELGLADCDSVAQLALAACTRAGYQARAAYGLLIAFPFSLPHSWVEVRVEDRWTPFDPVTATAIREFAGEQAPTITGSSSLGAMLLRIADRPVPLTSVDGVALDASFPTRRLAPGDHGGRS
jgi:hypothetical protein